MTTMIRVRKADGWHEMTLAAARAEQQQLRQDGWDVAPFLRSNAEDTWTFASRPNQDGSVGFESRLYRPVER